MVKRKIKVQQSFRKLTVCPDSLTDIIKKEQSKKVFKVEKGIYKINGDKE